MQTQTLTLHLPDPLYQRLRLMAQVTHAPLEEIAYQSLQGNLPPLLEDIPLEWRDELAPLPQLNDIALWTIIKEPLPVNQWTRHQQLLEQNQTGRLTDSEQRELATLRDLTDRFVFRRSYALALLKWRGHLIPPDSGFLSDERTSQDRN